MEQRGGTWWSHRGHPVCQAGGLSWGQAQRSWEPAHLGPQGLWRKVWASCWRGGSPWRTLSWQQWRSLLTPFLPPTVPSGLPKPSRAGAKGRESLQSQATRKTSEHILQLKVPSRQLCRLVESEPQGVLYAEPKLMEAFRFFPLHPSCIIGTRPLPDSSLSSPQGGANWKSCCLPSLTAACFACAHFSLYCITVIWGWTCRQGNQWGHISLFGNLHPPCPNSHGIGDSPHSWNESTHSNCLRFSPLAPLFHLSFTKSCWHVLSFLNLPAYLILFLLPLPIIDSPFGSIALTKNSCFLF